MSTNDNDTSSNNATGKKPPVFDGDHRYLCWSRLVGLWMSSLKDSDKPRAASALINAQTNDDVIDYMLEVPDEQLKSSEDSTRRGTSNREAERVLRERYSAFGMGGVL